jgi:hypothetical protein
MISVNLIDFYKMKFTFFRLTIINILIIYNLHILKLNGFKEIIGQRKKENIINQFQKYTYSKTFVEPRGKNSGGKAASISQFIIATLHRPIN